MRKAEREGDAQAIFASRIVMVAYFYNASLNNSKYSPTLMNNIVDYLGASTLTRKRMDILATSNLTGKVGSNIHQDKLNEIFVKQVKEIFKEFQRCLSDELIDTAVAASNPMRIIKNHALDSLDCSDLKCGGRHAYKVFTKKDEKDVRKLMKKYSPFKIRKQESKIKHNQKSMSMFERVKSDNFPAFVATKAGLYDVHRTP